MIMAGCMGLTEEDAEKIADELINVPGCDDESAYNYDENAWYFVRYDIINFFGHLEIIEKGLAGRGFDPLKFVS